MAIAENGVPEFPPRAGLERPRGSMPGGGGEGAPIPADLTGFVGRASETAEVSALVRQRRLVTLVGIGGVGKSRLAARVARGLARGRASSVGWADVSSVQGPTQLSLSILAALGQRHESDRAAAASSTIDRWVLAAIGSSRALVVLDGCDHLDPAARELIVQVLRACPRLRVLATSREPLGIYGESTCRVSPLPYRCANPEQPSDALRLFEQRAGETVAGLQLDAEGRAAAAQICALVEGIPLAIELAAKRLRHQDVHAVNAALHSHLTAPQDTRDRPWSPLDRVIRESFRRLDPEQRQMLARLSVFQSDFSPEAAAALGAQPSHLAALVDSSLVTFEHHQPRPRYRLLLAVRAFAGRELAQTDPGCGAHRAVAAWAVDVAERAEAALRSGRFEEAAALLVPERQMLRAAAAWLRDRAEVTLHARLAAALAWYWDTLGDWSEGAEHLRSAATARELDVPLHARVLAGLALFEVNLGAYGSSSQTAAAAAATLAAAGDSWGERFALQSLGLAQYFTGQSAEATSTLQRCLDAASAAGDRVNTAFALSWLAGIATGTGRPRDAILLYEQAIASWRLMGWLARVACCQTLLARNLQLLGRIEDARATLRDARQTAQACGSPRSVGWATLYLGHVERAARDLPAAVHAYLDSLAIRDWLGDQRGVAQCLEALAAAASRTAEDRPGKHRALAPCVAQALDRAAAIRARIGSPIPAYERAEIASSQEWAASVLGQQGVAVALAAGRPLNVTELVGPLRALAENPPAGPECPSCPQPTHAASHCPPLSSRERQTALLVASGLTSRQAAERLCIGKRTVDTHVWSAMRKLGLGRRAELAAWAATHGLLAEAPSGSAPVPHK
ncbi:MAG: NB-ARC domain-containing protein [Chloroflexota bacterium]